MKVLIVGGNFGDEPKPSGIVNKLGIAFRIECEEEGELTKFNGGELDELPHEIDNDLIVWMPNITNEVPKQYPKKSVGNVLIVSKVMREGYTDLDAVARIFKMRGNAVIAIYRETGQFRFKLIDALGNVWCDTFGIGTLYYALMKFYEFTRKAVRVPCNKSYNISPEKVNEDLDEFIQVNKSLAEHIQTSCGERFFGNISTRCAKLFPTMKINEGMFVSPRNVNKEHITSDDMVYCEQGDDCIIYNGDKKPSIDSPIQMKVYESCEDINYLIHGHAFIYDEVETSEYFLCGDLREAKEVIEIIGENKVGAINLKNHGFLLFSNTLKNMKLLISGGFKRPYDGLKFHYNRENS